ncbi:early nodulin-like protein 1 [Impatiens glandulifera]|uniref:early nodulin-like protein 1 n=1 Tax=Impatiens glandulifera TaxID=253017 RepID=UPI001FB0A8AB|nr:early nodulin-like protein 1 [Impatiens glandulifera]XP_047326324.1 early nodulin-like protein 1 [Impatiens glandulifera]
MLKWKNGLGLGLDLLAVAGFRYKKDSVMEVTEKEFNNCNSTRPISFSNNGHTKIEFERSGLFYFISGASGHCQLGQKMVVKVMSPDEDGNNRSSSSMLSGAYGGMMAMIHLALFCYFN